MYNLSFHFKCLVFFFFSSISPFKKETLRFKNPPHKRFGLCWWFVEISLASSKCFLRTLETLSDNCSPVSLKVSSPVYSICSKSVEECMFAPSLNYQTQLILPGAVLVCQYHLGIIFVSFTVWCIHLTWLRLTAETKWSSTHIYSQFNLPELPWVNHHVISSRISTQSVRCLVSLESDTI